MNITRCGYPGLEQFCPGLSSPPLRRLAARLRACLLAAMHYSTILVARDAGGGARVSRWAASALAPRLRVKLYRSTLCRLGLFSVSGFAIVLGASSIRIAIRGAVIGVVPTKAPFSISIVIRGEAIEVVHELACSLNQFQVVSINFNEFQSMPISFMRFD